MDEKTNASSFSLSIYDKHRKIIEKYKKKYRTKSEAAAIQGIIEQYHKLIHKGLKKDLVLFVVYPIIFCVFSLFYTININKVITISNENEYVLIPEVFLLQGVSTAIGFITVGILAMGFIFFNHVMRERYGN